jgi:hypothetical protein
VIAGFTGRPSWLSPHRPRPRLTLALAASLLLTLMLLFATWPRRPAPAAGAGDGRGLSRPSVRQAELILASTPSRGVWGELTVILDNPLVLGARRTLLYLPPTFVEDYDVRDTEPDMLLPPQRVSDGRYALTFPAPLEQSWNWYRVDLVARRAGPRPLQVTIAIEGGPARIEVGPATPRTRLADHAADPFLVIPEFLVQWVPGRSPQVFPLSLLAAGLMIVVLTGGCLALFRAGWTAQPSRTSD